MKKQSKIAIVVVLFVVVLAGGYYYYNYTVNEGVHVSDNAAKKEKLSKTDGKNKNNSTSASENKNGDGNSKTSSSSSSNSSSTPTYDDKGNLILPDVNGINLGLTYAFEINYASVKGKVASAKFYNGDKEVKSKAINLNDGKFTTEDEATRLELMDKNGKIIAVAKIKS
ncbi:hypothetical protein [Clostridium scatologenes]|uniref:Uncharacterized protein n=1 Tax=Clostridium scatologenes TaxID=1548 RepID=A0A0E3K302_CLOSL|nr:hypothetical protein [Clostridium scatologenes]AKA70849.1 hypothetical protein CSCA_3724 [Clostridium scatologenes]